MLADRPLVYLACPYSHPARIVREARWRQANRAAAELMARGLLVFSPISHGHPIAEAGGLPGDWSYWQAYSRAVLSICSTVVVLRLVGWEQSAGVAAELAIAAEQGLRVEYTDLREVDHG